MDDLEHKWNEIEGSGEEEEEEESTEYEHENKEKEVIEFEDEEGVEEVEELTPPTVTSWIDPMNGKTMHGVTVTTNDLSHPKKTIKSIRCQFDVCTICYHPWTSYGDHQLCCLPCGHMYGSSCIKTWLLQSSSREKACPYCKTLCSSKDVKLLYAPDRLCVAAHQKASSTRYFPFTKEGFYAFNAYEWERQMDAKKLQSYALKQLIDIKQQHLEATTHVERLSKLAAELGWHNAIASLASAWELGWQNNTLRQRELQANELGRQADALQRRADALGRVADAYKPRMDFFEQMCKEHHKRSAQQKKKNTNPLGVEKEHQPSWCRRGYLSQRLINLSLLQVLCLISIFLLVLIHY